jgi:hypothetical protein
VILYNIIIVDAYIAIRIMSDTNEGREQEREEKQETRSRWIAIPLIL